jgi:electron transfer flavoprotein alpha subunit
MSLDFSYLDDLLNDESEALVETEGEGHRHVWVVAEALDSRLTPATLEAMGQGREIADQFGLYLFSILLGYDLAGNLAEDLIAYGADKVLLIDDPALFPYQVEIYTAALSRLVRERRPEILILGASPLGNDLAPRLAQRLETGLISHCVQLSLDMAERQLLGTYARMGGEYFHTVSCPTARPQMVTLEPGFFNPSYQDSYRQGEIEQIELELENQEATLTWLDLEAALDQQPLSLGNAPVVIAAGRGMKDQQGYTLVEELAAALGGKAAGSRGAVDEGWIGLEKQIGLTGQMIKPDLYIACGISGAIQHYLGMQDAGFIVAINRDEDAPIIKAANVGVVGDCQEIISTLIAKLSKN